MNAARFEEKIFGSLVNDTASRASDIDISIEAPGMPQAEWSKLKEALEESSIIYKMDVVRFDVLPNNRLKEKIEHEGVEIVGGISS